MVAAETWNPQAAARYMDQRAKEWLAYKPAAAPGGTCASCHGQLLYALARPALRKTLHEGRSPTAYEQEIPNGLRFRLRNPEGGHMFTAFKKEPLASQSTSVEAVIAAFLLPGDTAALDRMWRYQDPKDGAFPWFSLQLEPWEGPESKFFGAVLAAAAVQNAPPEYRKRVATQIRDLAAYLDRHRKSQPLHNQLMFLWLSKPFLDPTARKEIVEAAWKVQNEDGSWTGDGLGPWSKPLRPGANGYATALAAYSLSRSGIPSKDPRLAKALAWLAANQNPATGGWDAQSMNKDRDSDSMPGKFMADAATSLAVLALTESKP